MNYQKTAGFYFIIRNTIKMSLRNNFPKKGEEYLGVTTDGWEYTTSFTGSTIQDSFQMLQRFLNQEGYQDIPLPKSAEELLLFKNPPNQPQMMLFNERGYFHNPIKIFFPNGKKKENDLILKVYNEQATNHLIKFHNVGTHPCGRPTSKNKSRQPRKKRQVNSETVSVLF